MAVHTTAAVFFIASLRFASKKIDKLSPANPAKQRPGMVCAPPTLQTHSGLFMWEGEREGPALAVWAGTKKAPENALFNTHKPALSILHLTIAARIPGGTNNEPTHTDQDGVERLSTDRPRRTDTYAPLTKEIARCFCHIPRFVRLFFFEQKLWISLHQIGMPLLLVFRRSRPLFAVFVCFTSASSKKSSWLSSSGCRCKPTSAKQHDGVGYGYGGEDLCHSPRYC